MVNPIHCFVSSKNAIDINRRSLKVKTGQYNHYLAETNQEFDKVRYSTDSSMQLGDQAPEQSILQPDSEIHLRSSELGNSSVIDYKDRHALSLQHSLGWIGDAKSLDYRFSEDASFVKKRKDTLLDSEVLKNPSVYSVSPIDDRKGKGRVKKKEIGGSIVKQQRRNEACLKGGEACSIF